MSTVSDTLQESVPVERLAEPASAEDALQPGRFLVLEGSPAWAGAVLRRIRRHPVAAVYLKPVAWVSEKKSEESDFDLVLADADAAALETWRRKAGGIWSRVVQLLDWDRLPDRSLKLRLLRYLATRGGVLQPRRTSRIPVGFVYRGMGALVGEGDPGLFSLLEELAADGYLDADFFTRAPFCQGCGSAFLHFIEICPRCGSAELQAEQVLHHYRCAYVGPIDDFRRERGLVCPKCQVPLRQLGTDYDRPADVWVCGRCRHTFEEAEVTTCCFRCESEVPAEERTWRTIHRYRITALGTHAARTGLLEPERSDYPDYLIPYPEFRKFLAVECHRLERYPHDDSTLLLFWWQLSSPGGNPPPRELHEWTVEFAQILKSYLRKTDLVTIPRDPVFLVLCLGTGTEGVRVVAEKIAHLARQLFQANVGEPPQLAWRVLSLKEPDAADVDRLVAGIPADD